MGPSKLLMSSITLHFVKLGFTKRSCEARYGSLFIDFVVHVHNLDATLYSMVILFRHIAVLADDKVKCPITGWIPPAGYYKVLNFLCIN